MIISNEFRIFSEIMIFIYITIDKLKITNKISI